MKKSNKIWLILLAIVVLMIIGACIGQLVEHWNWFQYSSEFNLFELLYFLFSVFIAGYIAYILEKGEQDRRGEKDLFIDRYKEIDEELGELSKSFASTPRGEHTISAEILLGKMKVVNVLIGRYQKALYKCYPQLEKKESHYQIMAMLELRRLTTLNKKGDESIRCVSNIWYYNNERMAQISYEINRLRSVCFDDILIINAL